MITKDPTGVPGEKARAAGAGQRTPPARRKGTPAPNLLDGRIGGYPWIGVGDLLRDEDNASDIAAKRSLAGFVAEYRAGRTRPL